METKNIFKKAVQTSLVCCLLASTNCYSQGAPVIDAASIIEQLVQQLNQLNQLRQQYIEYKLQIQNLEKLDENLRRNVLIYIQSQLRNNINDYGISELNGLPKLSSSVNTFYGNAETILTNNIGRVPATRQQTIEAMNGIGLDVNNPDGLLQGATIDRKKYERILDDMRQVSLTRSNAESRSTQANEITAKMASLDSNNTVGAIQLLAAQNSLSYAQMEDLIKNQAALIKNMQEEQARLLIENQKSRDKELKRIKKMQEQARKE